MTQSDSNLQVNRSAELAAFAEDRRSDWERRVKFECDVRAVPLSLEYRQGLYARFLKPFFERLIAAMLLLAALPVMVLIAIAISLSDGGPIFFNQSRTGYLGKRFTLYKFRTMVTNAEELKEKLRERNIHDKNSPDFKLKDDPRITKIGGFLRKTSLDELPNLFNVLKGDMVLVGPRPTSFDITTYSSQHYVRLAARPGITGLWQVSGRADIDFDGRAEIDARYIRSMSMKQDVSLLVRTFRAVIGSKGAY